MMLRLAAMGLVVVATAAPLVALGAGGAGCQLDVANARRLLDDRRATLSPDTARAYSSQLDAADSQCRTGDGPPSPVVPPLSDLRDRLSQPPTALPAPAPAAPVPPVAPQRRR